MAKNNKAKGIFGILLACLIVIVAIVMIIILNNREGGIAGLNDDYFKSDGTKLVIDLKDETYDTDVDGFKPTNSYLVYHYSDNNITSFKVYYKYNDAETAASAYEHFKDENRKVYQEIARDDVYVVLTINSAEYDGVTVNDIRTLIESNEADIEDEFEDEFEIEENVEDEIEESTED